MARTHSTGSPSFDAAFTRLNDGERALVDVTKGKSALAFGKAATEALHRQVVLELGDLVQRATTEGERKTAVHAVLSPVHVIAGMVAKGVTRPGLASTASQAVHEAARSARSVLGPLPAGVVPGMP